MFKNKFLKLGAWVGVSTAMILPSVVFADAPTPISPVSPGIKGSLTNLQAVGTAAQQTGAQADLPKLIGSFINVILGVLGIIFVVLIIQSGIQYMTSSGAEDKVKEAKKRMISAVIGIAIILAAYAISSFVINALSTAALAQ